MTRAADVPRRTSRGGSTVVRRQLGRTLRAMREATGRTRDDVVASRLMSRSKLEGIEHGRTMVRPGDAYELGRLYGASPEALESLREMAMATTQDGWWQQYSDGLVKGFDAYLDLESAATRILIYQPAVVHGLLQNRGLRPCGGPGQREPRSRREDDLQACAAADAEVADVAGAR